MRWIKSLASVDQPAHSKRCSNPALRAVTLEQQRAPFVLQQITAATFRGSPTGQLRSIKHRTYAFVKFSGTTSLGSCGASSEGKRDFRMELSSSSSESSLLCSGRKSWIEVSEFIVCLLRRVSYNELRKALTTRICNAQK